MTKTIQKLAKDHRVREAWEETWSGDGYWVALKRGWADFEDDPCQPTHLIHEWNIKAILRRMKGVKPCLCKECSK